MHNLAPMTMRFLILTQYFPPEIGAPQTRLAAFARELMASGHDVEIVTAMPNHLHGSVFAAYRRKFYCRERWNGARIHRTWIFAAGGTGLLRLLSYLSFSLSSLVGIALARRPTYVFVESPPLFLGVSGWFGALFHRSQLLFNVADLWPDSVKELGVMRDGFAMRAAERLERWTYRRARYVCSVTDGITERLVGGKALERSKILTLPNGIDPQLFAPRPPDERLRAEMGLGDERIVLYAGTHGIAQGLETLLEAAERLRDAGLLFLFVGAGSAKAALQAIAAERKLDNVRFVDPCRLEEMPRYYSIAFASIVPLRRNELFKGARPSKILPSLASGVPVVYSGEGEGAALIEDAGGGLVVPPESPELLATALLRLRDDPMLHACAAQRGRAYVMERFSWRTIVGRWLDELEGAA